MSEGAPTPEKAKEQYIPDQEAQDAYIRGDTERFQAWVGEQELRMEAYKGNPKYARAFYETTLARILYAAGEIEDAKERLWKVIQDTDEEAIALKGDQYPELSEQERSRRATEMIDFTFSAHDLVQEWERES